MMRGLGSSDPEQGAWILVSSIARTGHFCSNAIAADRLVRIQPSQVVGMTVIKNILEPLHLVSFIYLFFPLLFVEEVILV